MKTFFQWTGVLAVATALDLAVRFLLPFNLARVLAVEAVLFPVTGWVLLRLSKRTPVRGRVWAVARGILIAGFFLAGVRSLLWALGVPVKMANMVVILMAALGWIAFRPWALRKNSLSEDQSSS